MNHLNINEKFPYVYETHLHTSQASACGKNTGGEIAKACKAAGYSGIIVTDHFFYGNTAIDRSLPWRDWVVKFCQGYEDAKKVGDQISLKVFFGWEAGYNGSDFLIYGLDQEWLLSHPEIKDATIEEQFNLVKASDGMVIQAHPFREEFYIPEVRLFPDYVHGVEVMNATHTVKYSVDNKVSVFDIKAQEYAQSHNLPRTAGSDLHSINLFYGGMAFKRELKTIRDYINAVKLREECYLYTGGLKS